MNVDEDAPRLVRRARACSKLTESDSLELARRETQTARRVRKPVDRERLRALVQATPRQPEGAARSLRRLRGKSRY